jgi:hypothetical protein
VAVTRATRSLVLLARPDAQVPAQEVIASGTHDDDHDDHDDDDHDEHHHDDDHDVDPDGDHDDLRR